MGMVGRRFSLLLLVVVATLQLSFAAVYKVGDSAGWTTIGNVDYKKWASTKTFHVGDIIRTTEEKGKENAENYLGMGSFVKLLLAFSFPFTSLVLSQPPNGG
ncbi:hypothetical protein CK203_001289 [Vitis vinifera]|uniref:Phytocyanin domain-containing protein n=1 Tax=Vitis vinifera TaxID=29760 RepID=A0A438KLA3_VITVI|nr:hypothetical protein CK203_001289 [Vitis vinifera]